MSNANSAATTDPTPHEHHHPHHHHDAPVDTSEQPTVQFPVEALAPVTNGAANGVDHADPVVEAPTEQPVSSGGELFVETPAEAPVEAVEGVSEPAQAFPAADATEAVAPVAEAVGQPFTPETVVVQGSPELFNKLLDAASAGMNAKEAGSTFTVQGKSEPLKKFIDRLVVAVGNCPDEVFYPLFDEEGQAFVTLITDIHDYNLGLPTEQQKAYPPIPGMPSEVPEAVKAPRVTPKAKVAKEPKERKAGEPKAAKEPKKGMEMLAEELAAKHQRKADREKAKAEKAARKAAQEATGRVQRAPSSVSTMRKLIIQNPDISLEELGAKMVEAGYDVKPTTLTTIRTDTRSTIKDAMEMGYWKS